MCWNAEVSLKTFLVGIVGIGLAAFLGMSLPVVLFSLTIVFMQLIEYIVWTYYDDEDVNYKASLAAAALLWLQPIASMLLIPSTSLKVAMLSIYTILSLAYSLVVPNTFDKKHYSMKKAENGHLSWKFLSKEPRTYLRLAVFFFFLFVPILITKNLDLLAMALTTLGLSLYSYWRDNTWGSMWCWIVNGIVLLAVGKTVVQKL
jgi:hypothetical protein